MDPQHAAKLVGLDAFPHAYREHLQYEYSDSAMMVYLGIEGLDLRDYGFGRHNTWRLSQWDMNQTWREQNVDDNHANPWLFISTPTLLTHDQSHAPPGGQIHGARHIAVVTVSIASCAKATPRLTRSARSALSRTA